MSKTNSHLLRTNKVRRLNQIIINQTDNIIIPIKIKQKMIPIKLSNLNSNLRRKLSVLRLTILLRVLISLKSWVTKRAIMEPRAPSQLPWSSKRPKKRNHLATPTKKRTPFYKSCCETFSIWMKHPRWFIYTSLWASLALWHFAVAVYAAVGAASCAPKRWRTTRPSR